MRGRPCVTTEDRFASLIALEALGLLSEPISDGVRMHLRACHACQMHWHELRSRSDMFELGARRGEAGERVSPEFLKSVILRATRAGRSRKPRAGEDPPSISDCPFVECAPGEQWAVTGDNGVTLVYRIISPPTSRNELDVRNDSTRFGIVLEGSLTIRRAGRASQRLGVWDTYTVPAGLVHVEEFHERTLVFEVYAPNNLDYEEHYDRQVQRWGSTAPGGATR